MRVLLYSFSGGWRKSHFRREKGWASSLLSRGMIWLTPAGLGARGRPPTHYTRYFFSFWNSFSFQDGSCSRRDSEPAISLRDISRKEEYISLLTTSEDDHVYESHYSSNVPSIQLRMPYSYIHTGISFWDYIQSRSQMKYYTFSASERGFIEMHRILNIGWCFGTVTITPFTFSFWLQKKKTF